MATDSFFPKDFKMPDFTPPTPYVSPPPLTIDVAEFNALRTIVMVIVAIMAKEREDAGGPPAQAWINTLAERSIEALTDGTITDSNGRELRHVRERSIAQVNEILGQIKFPKLEGGN